MYYTFKNTHIITGYIKELLKDFNLPMAKVYNENKPLRDGKFYIKNKELYYCDTNLKLVRKAPYEYNKKVPNLTRNLIINSSNYDIYTHTYLGDYLRFIRDYRHLDLMPLYNCFNTERPIGLNFSGAISSINPNYTEDAVNTYSIDTDDTLYNYYIVPVKFDETYTIAIDSDVPYDICCIIYTGDNVLDIAKTLVSNTLTKIQGSSFSRPYTFDTTMPADATVGFVSKNSRRYQDYENNLRLLIKLPKKVNSSIVVLEGNYSGSCSSYMGQIAASAKYSDEAKLDGMVATTSLSLLSVNDGESYPFADRLVEYLSFNAISHLEDISDNVARIQNIIYKHKPFEGYYDIWDSNINRNINERYNDITHTNFAKIYKIDEGTESSDTPGTLVYEQLRFCDEHKDLLTYVDKDIEYYLDNLKNNKNNLENINAG